MFGRRTVPLAQDQAPPWNRRGHRSRARERQQPPPPMNPWPTAPGVADSYARYSPSSNDQQVRRENTPWIPTPNVSVPGTGRASWWAAGPARPSLEMRSVTTNPRVGNSRSRFAQNPLAPGTGLHTQPRDHSVGTIQRYVTPGVGKMRPARQNRLSPARYEGQSYSQTTITQGAR